MSLILITGDGPEHRYVANMIGAAHSLDAIFVCDPPRRRSWQSVLKKSRTQFLDKLLRSLFLRLVFDSKRRELSLKGVLGPAADAFGHEDLIVRVGRPNAEILAKVVRQLKPDVIAVYGTGIIPEEVLNNAKTIALNMHTGLSPWYRGTACAFWPIVNREPDMIGATVHECTSRVDGGQIFFRDRASPFRQDDLHAIFARCVAVGASGYVDVIAKALEGTLVGQSQDLSLGTEYRGAMLGIRSELAARRARRKLARQWPTQGLPERGAEYDHASSPESPDVRVSP